ncbi:MAG: hypothetical protein HWQ38_25060 [Nostoc sp. NMS7]|uniref:hypothetical protein n=1 Tax=Nostoc sp. NMS7 TaxID=2815391 RepID=UPI0025EB9B30|nr:hypothetical protein [Nostoc sp. NMS7]MBN3949553.1 hypothetical protein [Nostoc sp. NMS7]
MSTIRKSTIVVGTVGFIVFSVLLLVFLPWSFNFFGYALPGKGGLPCPVSYGHRVYIASNKCIGVFSYGIQLPCRTELDLIDKKSWPLTQVGQIPTLLGEPYPLFLDAPSIKQIKQWTPTGVFVRTGSNCYIGYNLSGGP